MVTGDAPAPRAADAPAAVLAGVRLAVVGAGHMGRALIVGLLRAAALPPAAIVACGRRRPRLGEALAGVHTSDQLAAALAGADVVVVAVRPADLAALMPALAAALPPRALVISVIAGVPRARLAAALGDPARVARAMPNVALAVGAGATALALDPGATAVHRARATALFAAAGRVVALPEPLLDAATGVAGSGVAFALVAAGALAAGGEAEGLAAADAQALAAQALAGAAALLATQGARPDALCAQIASPGGTTAAGLARLAAAGTAAGIAAAVSAATARARALGS